MNRLTRISSGFGLVLLMACSAEQPAQLQLAHTALIQAKADPFVVEHAPHALNEADSTFQQAEQAWRSSEDPDLAVPLANQTLTEIEMARKTAEDNAIAESKQQALVNRELNDKNSKVVALQKQNQMIMQTNQMLVDELDKLKDENDAKNILLTLNSDLLFDVDKTQLKPGAKRSLEPLVTYLER
ncbi:MAG: DUF4398 domain-containing protein, partial [Bdellovibrionales bacterium]|nr:DUF4398 domain-containing protein [Bdellovibrionales bacterium]